MHGMQWYKYIRGARGLANLRSPACLTSCLARNIFFFSHNQMAHVQYMHGMQWHKYI